MSNSSTVSQIKSYFLLFEEHVQSDCPIAVQNTLYNKYMHPVKRALSKSAFLVNLFILCVVQ